MQQGFRVFVIVVHHVTPIGFGGIRAGALMKNHFRFRQRGEFFQQKLFIEVIGITQSVEIEMLGGITQMIHNQDLFFAHLVQSFDQIAADETCSSGDNDHPCSLIFLMILVVEWPSRNGRTLTVPPFVVTVWYPTISSAR